MSHIIGTDITPRPEYAHLKRVESTGTRPDKRSHHLSWLWQDTHMYIFGGESLSEYTCDMYMLNIKTRHWHAVQQLGAVPSPRSHSACELVHGYPSLLTSSLRHHTPQPNGNGEDDETCVIVYGGQVDSQKMNDLHVFVPGTRTWYSVSKNAQAKWPAGVSGHAIACIKRDIYLFGGVDSEMNRPNYLWKLNIDTFEWTRVETNGLVPQGRDGHCLVAIDDDLIMYGGWSGSEWLNDLHVFRTSTHSWHVLSPLSESIPSPRSYFAYAVLDSCLYVIGGQAGLSYGDVWSIDLASVRWINIADIDKHINLHVHRSGHSSVISSLGHVYVWGGVDDEGERLRATEVLDISCTHISPDKSFVEVPTSSPYLVNHACHLKIYVHTRSDRPIRLGAEDPALDIELLVKDSHERSIESSVDVDDEDAKHKGKYTATFYPKCKGPHYLSVKINDMILVDPSTCMLMVYDELPKDEVPVIITPTDVDSQNKPRSVSRNATAKLPDRSISPRFAEDWKGAGMTRMLEEPRIPTTSPMVTKKTPAPKHVDEQAVKRSFSVGKMLYSMGLRQARKRLRTSGQRLIVWDEM